MTDNQGDRGYEAKNRISLDPKYLCPICRYILKNPIQLSCGDRVCEPCLSKKTNFMQCPKCDEDVSLSQMMCDKGFQNDMKILHIECYLCDWSGDFVTYHSHLEESHKDHRCSHCNEIFNAQTLLHQHQEQACLQMPVDCLLHPYGCKKKILRCDLSQHYQSEEHQNNIVSRVLTLNSEMKIAKQKHHDLNTHLRCQTGDVSDTITTCASLSLENEQYSGQHESIVDVLNTMSLTAKVFEAEIVRLKNEAVVHGQSIDATNKDMETLQKTSEESNLDLKAVITNLDILQQDCHSLKEKLEQMQATSYDGIMLWKISDFSNKMVDAQSERQVSIYSPSFYSSPTGYKMCARLYMYGDGNARRTHMSLFFVLMRSQNDSLLKFPFNYKVTFCLFDQSGNKRHIIDSFRPDQRSSSFQKPRCDMNIASGIPKFVPLSMVQEPNNPYVKDDTMFIKIMIDFENIPKTVLSYAIDLNPALPTHVQHRLIQVEMERKKHLEQTSSTNTANS